MVSYDVRTVILPIKKIEWHLNNAFTNCVIYVFLRGLSSVGCYRYNYSENEPTPASKSTSLRLSRNVWLQFCNTILFMWNRIINICSLWFYKHILNVVICCIHTYIIIYVYMKLCSIALFIFPLRTVKYCLVVFVFTI